MWYGKGINYPYRFKPNPTIIDQYSYKYKFWDTTEKKIRGCQIYSLFSQLIGKGFNFERKVMPGMTLIVWLNEKQKLVQSFFLHRSTKGGTEYLIIFLGKYYYRDINLYFVYDKVYKQWFTSSTRFYYETICEKVTNPNFKLIEFMKKFYYTEKKSNGYAIGTCEQRQSLGNRSYLMPLI